jgi:hypothetical protein
VYVRECVVRERERESPITWIRKVIAYYKGELLKFKDEDSNSTGTTQVLRRSYMIVCPFDGRASSARERVRSLGFERVLLNTKDGEEAR